MMLGLASEVMLASSQLCSSVPSHGDEAALLKRSPPAPWRGRDARFLKRSSDPSKARDAKFLKRGTEKSKAKQSGNEPRSERKFVLQTNNDAPILTARSKCPCLNLGHLGRIVLFSVVASALPLSFAAFPCHVVVHHSKLPDKTRYFA